MMIHEDCDDDDDDEEHLSLIDTWLHCLSGRHRLSKHDSF
jgi:hypothetical protein